MIKVEITNLSTNSIGWAAQFDTQEAADAWIQAEIANNSFGKPERWVRESQEDVSHALETRTVEDFPAQDEIKDEDGNVIQGAKEAETHIEYKLAAQYTVEQTDITAQVQQDTLIQDGKKRQDLGAAVIAKVYSINEGKNISQAAFAAMIADANLERIERMLWTGSLRTAKLMIQALDNTYFTTNEKSSILDLLADY